MNKIGGLFIGLGLAGLTVTALLLFTNHAGFALRVSGYVYFLLLAGVIYEIIFFKN